MAAALVIPSSGTATTTTTFVDATQEAGVIFQHTGGGVDPFFPEMMGSGACWFDADNDGYDDLFIVNGKYNDSRLQELYHPTGKYFRNNGDGTFADETETSGLAFEGWGNGCSVADWNADGCMDLYAAGYGISNLYRGACDGTFANVTAEAGVFNLACQEGYPCWPHSSAWADYDEDGDLDLYVGNYVGVMDEGPHFNAPGPYQGQKNALYRNNGDGTFTDVAEAAGVTGWVSYDCCKTLAVGWQDYDLDGDPDLYVANDEVPQQLYRNNGDGTFTDVAPETGVNWIHGGMGVAWGDLDHNGCPEVIIAFFSFEYEGIGWNYCNGDLLDESDPKLLHGLEAHIRLVRWSNVIWDYDNDGWSDYLVVTGYVYYNPGDPIDQQPILYRNKLFKPEPIFTFENVTSKVGDVFQERQNARGAAFGDYNLDGTLDFIIVANNNESARLVKGINSNRHYIELQLRQPGTKNLHAIGSRVTVVADGITQVKELVSGSGFESANTFNLHFGTNNATTVERISVEWPDGAVEVWEGLPADGLYRLTRGDPVALDDVVSPNTVAKAHVAPAASGWYLSPITVTLEATDRGVQRLSGVKETLYSSGGVPLSKYTAPLELGAGTHPLEFRSMDLEGNEEPLREATFRVDLEDPVTRHEMSQAPFPSGWYPEGTMVSLSATDDSSGVAYIRYRLDSGFFTRYTGPLELPPGEHVLEYHAVDVAGREEAMHRIEVRVDDRLPNTSAEYDGLAGDNGWWRSALTITLSAEDQGSGILETRYALNGGPEQIYHGPFLVAEAGIHSFRYWSLDLGGNAEIPHNAIFRIDASLPASRDRFDAIAGNAPWLTKLVLHMEGSDLGSGIRELRYRMDGGEFRRALGPVTLPDGRYLLETGAIDVAGNAEPLRAQRFDVDATPPVTLAAIDGPAGRKGWWTGNVTASLSASDATSGLVGTSASLDAMPLSPYEGPIPVVGEGRHSLRFASEDAAGNVEPLHDLPVLIDWTAPETRPVLDGTGGTAGWHVSPVRVTLDARDAVSAVATTHASGGGNELPSTFTLLDGVHEIRFWSEDVAGNVESERILVVAVDTQAPTTRLSVDRGALHAGIDAVYLTRSTYVTLEAADATSGVAGVHYRINGGPPTLLTAPFSFPGAEGAHELEFWSVDVAGNEEARQVLRIVVDESAPGLAVLRPGPTSATVGKGLVAAGAPVEGPAVLVGDELEVVAAANDGAGAGIRAVRLFLDGSLLGNMGGVGRYTWYGYVPLEMAGPHVLRVEAEDHLGHVSVVERPVVFVVAFTSLVEKDARRVLDDLGLSGGGPAAAPGAPEGPGGRAPVSIT